MLFDAPAALEGWFSSFDIGYNHTDRSKDKQQPEGNLTPRGAPVPLPAD